MANKMSLCIIKYTYTRYVGVDIEKYTRGLFEYVKEEFGEFQPQMSEQVLSIPFVVVCLTLAIRN